MAINEEEEFEFRARAEQEAGLAKRPDAFQRFGKYLPTAGAVAGGLLGAGAGGFPAIGGAALGAGAGEAGRQLLGRALGEPSPQTSGQAARQIGVQGAVGAGSEVFGQGLGKLAGAAFKGIPKIGQAFSGTPARNLAKAQQRGLLGTYFPKISRGISRSQAGASQGTIENRVFSKYFEPEEIIAIQMNDRGAADKAVFKGLIKMEKLKPNLSGKMHEETGLPLSNDGMVTLYHGTTKKSADEIFRTKNLKSAGEPDVYFTTDPAGGGYGDGTVVKVKVRPDRLLLEDEFPSGRRDFRIALHKPGGFIKIDPIEPLTPKEAIAVVKSVDTLMPSETSKNAPRAASMSRLRRYANDILARSEPEYAQAKKVTEATILRSQLSKPMRVQRTNPDVMSGVTGAIAPLIGSIAGYESKSILPLLVGMVGTSPLAFGVGSAALGSARNALPPLIRKLIQRALIQSGTQTALQNQTRQQ